MSKDLKNTGHGHVHPRPDGFKARCGGPGICSQCSQEAAAAKQALAAPEPLRLADEYAETRHRCGSHLYNAKTEAARNALHAALSAAAPAAPAGSARGIPGNFTTHRNAWHHALEIAKSHAIGVDVSYWEHELRAFDRSFDILWAHDWIAAPQAQQPTAPQEGAPAGEVVYAGLDHATVRWDAQTSDHGGGDPKNTRSWPIAGTKVYLVPPTAAQPQAGAESYPPELDDAFSVARSALVHCPDRASVLVILATLRSRVDDTIDALRARGAVPSAPWAALSLDEVRDLTAMQAGAPWDDHYLQPLAEVLVIYESLRATGARPVDPARSGASAGLPSFADWLKRAYRQLQDFYTVHNMEAAYVAGQHSAATPAAVSAPSVPEGWKLVPVQPTETMVIAGYDAYGVHECYAAMLAAAPQAPAGE